MRVQYKKRDSCVHVTTPLQWQPFFLQSFLVHYHFQKPRFQCPNRHLNLHQSYSKSFKNMKKKKSHTISFLRLYPPSPFGVPPTERNSARRAYLHAVASLLSSSSKFQTTTESQKASRCLVCRKMRRSRPKPAGFMNSRNILGTARLLCRDAKRVGSDFFFLISLTRLVTL